VLKKIKQYFKQTVITHARGFCCITFLPQEVALAYVMPVSGIPQLQFCDSFTFSKPSAIKPALAELVKKYHLEGVACSWMLQSHHYQLLLTESLPVTQAEFQSAIRWKIKDSVPFPIEEAVIDSFPIPSQKSVGAENKIIVIVARESYLSSFARTLQECQLRLTTVDIPEMALRNITALYEQDEKTTALIYLQEHQNELIISKQKQLYFPRRLEVEYEHFDPSIATDKEINTYISRLSLEIQRSFDYFQTQWRNPSPSRIFLATTKFSAEKIAEYLSQNLSLPVKPLNLDDVLSSKQKLTLAEQGKYLTVIGGALRESAFSDATELHETGN